MSKLVLIANPGSASRKYALFDGDKLLGSLHFEFEKKAVVYTLQVPGNSDIKADANLSHIAFAATKVMPLFSSYNIASVDKTIDAIGLRVVAPATHFQQDRLLDASEITKLRELEPRAELHINATLQEAELLHASFKGVPLVGVSDSAFQSTKPDYAATYGISQKVAKKADVWRFGYHGLSVSSVVGALKHANHLPKRLVVCHLGSGASVTAVKDGKSIDTTMGYSPLEGLVMATRSGSIDPTATQAIASELKLTSKKLHHFLNAESGLLGLSGASDDIRELLKLEDKSDGDAKLALATYVYRVQLAIGQMTAALGGIDGLVFTGTVGERSAILRQRIIKPLLYLGLTLDHDVNQAPAEKTELATISQKRHPAIVMVVPADESTSILRSVNKLF